LLTFSFENAIARLHCFNDRNIRTAFKVLDIVLYLNGIRAVCDVD